MCSCYLVARHKEKSIAVKAEWGKELASLVDYLSRKTVASEIEILTVSSLTEWYEYGPYEELDSEKVFICRVFDILEEQKGQ